MVLTDFLLLVFHYEHQQSEVLCFYENQLNEILDVTTQSERFQYEDWSTTVCQGSAVLGSDVMQYSDALMRLFKKKGSVVGFFIHMNKNQKLNDG